MGIDEIFPLSHFCPVLLSCPVLSCPALSCPSSSPVFSTLTHSHTHTHYPSFISRLFGHLGGLRKRNPPNKHRIYAKRFRKKGGELKKINGGFVGCWASHVGR